MFVSRANQENAIYEQQTAAAAKPLNQGVKGLAPKTPANKAPKTPFKVPLNDENATFGGGKTDGKAKQAGLFGEGKSGKVDRSAFVTPAGPRNRAPLGNKTTNAKATAFKTPAPPTQEKPSATKQTSPRLRRAKIKVHEAEPEIAEYGSEEREIEYMPPREVALPDYPDDWPHDRTYPQFEGRNLTRGWWSEFTPLKDGDDSEEFSDFEEKLKKVEEMEEKKTKQQVLKKKPVVSRDGLQKATRDPLTAKAPQTLKAKHAASVLSKPAATAHFAAPTAAAKSRLPPATVSKKPVTTSTAPGAFRHAAAKAVSNTTLGYSKGRAVSATARKPLSEVHGRQIAVKGEEEHVGVSSARMPFAAGTSLDDLLVLTNGLDIGEDDELGGSHGGPTVLEMEEDDALVDFQLDSVEI